MAERKASKKPVDYMKLVGCVQDPVEPDEDVIGKMPEPKGEQAVDYLAASDVWGKIRTKVMRGQRKK